MAMAMMTMMIINGHDDHDDHDHGHDDHDVHWLPIEGIKMNILQISLFWKTFYFRPK